MRSDHPDPELSSVWTDCPHCGREEWFQVFVDQKRAIVHCQFGHPLHTHLDYIIRYEIR